MGNGAVKILKLTIWAKIYTPSLIQVWSCLAAGYGFFQRLCEAIKSFDSMTLSVGQPFSILIKYKIGYEERETYPPKSLSLVL